MSLKSSVWLLPAASYRWDFSVHRWADPERLCDHWIWISFASLGLYAKGWEIEKETYASELLRGFDEFLAKIGTRLTCWYFRIFRSEYYRDRCSLVEPKDENLARFRRMGFFFSLSPKCALTNRSTGIGKLGSYLGCLGLWSCCPTNLSALALPIRLAQACANAGEWDEAKRK